MGTVHLLPIDPSFKSQFYIFGIGSNKILFILMFSFIEIASRCIIALFTISDINIIVIDKMQTKLADKH